MAEPAFARSAPGTSEEIAEFCSTTYGVTFPLFEEIEVDGPGRRGATVRTGCRGAAMARRPLANRCREVGGSASLQLSRGRHGGGATGTGSLPHV